MQAEEIDAAIEALETRLERLRSLYDQYFLGIEKAEPSVVRKDVDRRFWDIRKIQIRNTARRFRLQTLVQRYNTLQQYWSRTLREIEAGRYRPHLQRAEKRLALDAQETLRTGRLVPQSNAEEVLPAEPDAAEARRRAAKLARELELELEASLDDPFSGTSLVPSPPASSRVPTAAGARAARDHEASEERYERDTPPASERVSAPPSSERVSAPPASAVCASDAAEQAPAMSGARAAVGRGGAGVVRPPASAVSSSLRLGGPFAAASSPGGTLPPQRLAELHAELSAVRGKLGQGGTISPDKLERQLGATLKRLSGEHPGRQIDFRVVVRDGQAIIRPTMR